MVGLGQGLAVCIVDQVDECCVFFCRQVSWLVQQEWDRALMLTMPQILTLCSSRKQGNLPGVCSLRHFFGSVCSMATLATGEAVNHWLQSGFYRQHA
jgi:hypothetical protein